MKNGFGSWGPSSDEKNEKKNLVSLLMFELVDVKSFSHRTRFGLGVFRVDEGEYELDFFFCFFKKSETRFGDW
jgi:hypothetical protein